MRMSNTLDRILQVKRQEIAAAQEHTPLAQLQQTAEQRPKCRNFYRAITQPNPRGLNVIAEIKRASPSAGLIRPDFDPVQLAQTYQKCGADALSVLTDEQFFQGKLEYLNQAKQATDLPILRKDFIIDPYQVYQARAAGADAILLIAEALEPAQLMDLMILANSLTLTVLLEVHELDRLLQVRSLIGFPQARYSLIGINNRNLRTFETTLTTTERLAPHVPDDRIVIGESGIGSHADLERLARFGVRTFLVGESLMRQADVAAATRGLLTGTCE